MNLSFSGCGFLGIYHLGVAKTLASEGKQFINRICRFGGASAGALIASMFAVHGADEGAIETCKQFCLDLAEDIKTKTFGVFTPGVELLIPVEKFLEEQFPLDAHIRASGRLFISVTNADTKENEIISEFSSRDSLIKFLLASSCIPYITKSTSITIGDKKYFDGGLTNNMPLFHEGETICVSPFEGKHEICPSVTLSNPSPSMSPTGARQMESETDPKGAHVTLFNQNFKLCLDNLMRGIHIFSPPSVEMLKKYYRQGREDAYIFLVSRDYNDEHESPDKKSHLVRTSSVDVESSDDRNRGNRSNYNASSFCYNCRRGDMNKCTSVGHYHDAYDDVMVISVESSVDECKEDE